MPDFLSLSQWRYLRTHPWLLLLSLLGVAFGVAGIVAMDLAIQSCQRAFQLSQESISGPATHWIVGAPAGIPEETYRKLRLELGVEACVPVVEGYVTVALEGNPPQSFRLLGLDPIAEGPFRGNWLQGKSQGNLPTAFAVEGAVAMSAREAQRLGLQLESLLKLQETENPLRVRAILDGLDNNRQQALQGLLLSDIAVAQEVLRMEGKLSRIELILKESQATQLHPQLPEGLSLIAAETRSQASQQMSLAFFLNLKALSLLSLLVGLFLIYNVIHFLALQRRPWMAQLRILGVSRREIRMQILAEAAWIGALGSLLGIALGVALSSLLLPLLTRTLNDLYYSLQVQQVQLSLPALLKGSLLGWLCALVAAWFPAQEASRISAVEALRRSPLEGKALGWSGRIAGAASLMLMASLGLLYFSEEMLINLVAMFGIILGSASLTPAVVVMIQGGLLRMLPQGGWLMLKLVLGSLERSLSRLGVALVAMTVALSAVISITLMVHSFRLSLLDWLDRTLSADLYIGQINRRAAQSGQGLSPELLQRLAREPGIAQIVQLRMTPVYFTPPGGLPTTTQLAAQTLQHSELKRLRFLQPKGPAQPPQDGQLFASEPFMRRKQLQLGESIQIATPKGLISWTITGVFQDYASDSGYLMMDLPQYQRYFGDNLVSGLGVYLDPKGPSNQDEALREKILTWPESAALEVRSQRSLRKLSVEIFEQTFQVTGLLQILAVLVACAGIAGAVAANQLERRREFALWTCLGLSRWQRRALQWSEASLCALWAGLAAWPCGLLQGYAMVHFINRRAFGWSLDFHIDGATLLMTPLLALVSATLAVALSRTSGRSPAEDLRQE